MKKNFGIMILTVAMLCCLLVCGCAGASADDSNVSLRIATGGMTGTNYISGAAVSALINDCMDGAIGYVEATSGANENIDLLKSGEVELGYCNSTTAVESMSELGDISSIGVMMMQDIHIITNKKSNITCIEDLRGKKISVGSMGSGVEVVTESFLKIFGIGEDEYSHVYGSTSEAFEQVASGDSDCYLAITTVGGSSVTECLNKDDVQLLSLDEETLKGIADSNTQYMVDTIPAGTYSNINEDYMTLSAPVLLLVRNDLSEDEVYNLAKTIYENHDFLVKQSKLMEACTPENATLGNPVSLHAGVVKYFREKGIL